MNVRSICILAVIVVISAASYGQNPGPSEPLRLSMDYARFRGDENNLFVEVYYSIPQRSITYVPDSSGMKATVDVTLLVSTQRDSVVFADRWLVPSTIADAANRSGAMNLVGVARLMLGEGDYTLRLIARDRNDLRRSDSVAVPLPIKMLDRHHLVLSDIELATSIRQGGSAESPYHKNSLEVIPNVDAIFAEDQSCYIYAEAYNLLSGGTTGDYFVRTNVYDAVGRELITREKPRRRSAESSVIVDNLVMKQLRSGTYTLVMALLDSSHNVVSSSGKKFFVYNRTLGVDSAMLSLAPARASAEFSFMEEPELDREFEWAKYEAVDAEKAQYEKLSGTEAKRKFLTDFWARRQPGRRQQFLDRVKHANATFTFLGRSGYLSDRGRVYVVYGPPDDYDRHPSESETRPYEIWSYNSLQGGVIFVFALRQASGDYELVHSTHRNELQDENWSRYITR